LQALKAKRPKGDHMKKMTCAGFDVPALRPSAMIAAFRSISRVSVFGAYAVFMSAISAAGISVAALPERALAQADGPALEDMPFDMTWPNGGASAMTGLPLPADPLPPTDIIAEVRREGFHPVSRPVHRGRVYVLFAVDQDDMDVKLTVDAASGRVLWAAGAVAHLGGPGHYRSHWRAERPPVSSPGDDIPNAASPVRSNARAAGRARNTPLKRFPPLPRTRPVDLDDGSAASMAHGESQTSAVVPPATTAPVAPLE
jgi:hypothetical protein